jgi:histidinol phosphatase-like enzyme (inositol monophosphatase family)
MIETKNHIQKYIDAATQSLDESRKIIQHYFRRSFVKQNKSDGSPVTNVDILVEDAIREIITIRYPEHGVSGEERDHFNPQASVQWVIDPIDGTKSFVTGFPIFGTLVGITIQSKPIVGIIDAPILDERWVGVSAQETLLNGLPCQTSSVENLERANLYCTEPDIFKLNQLEIFNRLSEKVQLRRFGGDCYSYGLLASGHIDLIVEGGMKYHDVAALIPVIKGAGGVITDWKGSDINNEFDGLVVAASTSALHQKALKLLSSFYQN